MKLLLRSAAVVSATALCITTFASGAFAESDPQPATSSGTWLAGELTDGLLHYPDTGFGAYDDYGLSIDAALALAATDQRPAAVTAVSDAIAGALNSYITGEAFGDAGSTYAGATAKAAVLASTAGDDPTSYGGVDLVTRLEGRVSSTAPIAGRIEDASSFGDYANVIGQAFASEALHRASSAKAAAVTDFLLQQQCAAGYFRVSFTADKTASDQSCDGGAGAADTDATALVVLALQDQVTDPDVGDALDAATTWLAAGQLADGSFTSGDPLTPDKNTNSTGLAGWALGAMGDVEAAGNAALWVRRNQAADTARCTTGLTSERGALAYDGPGLVAGRSQGITDATRDQWRRATAQALPVLQWAPDAVDPAGLRGPARFVRAKSTQTLTITGLAPAERGCLYGPGVKRVVQGTGDRLTRVVTVPAGTADRVYAVSSIDGVERTTVKVLGALSVPFTLGGRTVAKGGVQKVRVSGLHADEKVTIRWRGKVVSAGTAGAKGGYTDTFRVGRKAGAGKIRVTGQFANLRTHTKSFTVR